MTYVDLPREKISLLFIEAQTSQSSALCEYHSASNSCDKELAKLNEQLHALELQLDSITNLLTSTQVDIRSKKISKHVEKQKVDFTNAISELEEEAEKLQSEAAHLTTEYEEWKEEKDKKIREMKEIFEAHCQAMHLYKKNLNIYIDINDDKGNTFTVYFFRTVKESGNEYTVKLRREEDRWQMICLNPHLPVEKKLQEHLAQTNDIQGFLVCVRNLFKRHRDRKH